jgi:hypothetical protein
MNAISKRLGATAIKAALILKLGAGGAELAASAQDLTTIEYKTKAGWLYNFAKLTDWPAPALPAARGSLVIGWLGQDGFGPVLAETLKGKKVGDREIIVRHCQRPGDAKGCQILYISATEWAHMPAVLAELRGLSILTVAETESFLEQGGMIRLIKQDEAVRNFEINTNATAKAGLTLSSRLLQLAVNLRAGRLAKGGVDAPLR